MAEPEINIRTDPRPTARASGRAKRPLTSPVVLLASAAVCAAIAIVILVAVNSSWPNIAAPAKPDTSSNRPDHASAMPAAPEGGESPSGEEIVDDPQGKLLWASPTASAPLSLAYVPSGTQCLLHLRPAELVAHPEGERTLAALGPWGRQTVVRLKSIVPAELSEIDSLLAAFVIRDDGALDA
ncbi:MAG TPA: hypothetical protein VF175_07235, partial [Lacipirellula sp.]